MNNVYIIFSISIAVLRYNIVDNPLHSCENVYMVMAIATKETFLQDILKKCFLSTTYIVIAVVDSNL